MVDDRNGDAVLTTSITTLRLWLKATLWQNAFLYVRGRDMYMRVIDEEYRSEVETTDNIIDLDVGFISMASSGRAVQFQAGRKFFILGTGLVFNGRGDGAELRLNSSIADLKLFGLYTGLLEKDVNPYGLSSRDLSDGAKRIFAGGSIERGIRNQTIYLMGMAQIDRAEEEDDTKSRYHSQYYGGGLKGLLMDGMDYYAEFVYQTGTNSLSGEEVDITAMAGMFGLNYYFNSALKPAILLQYAYGSGDDDTADDKDLVFNYFGTYVGGFALRPKLTEPSCFPYRPFSCAVLFPEQPASQQNDRSGTIHILHERQNRIRCRRRTWGVYGGKRGRPRNRRVSQMEDLRRPGVFRELRILHSG